MGPVQAIRTGIAKSFQFSGRASRSEFGWFAAAYIIGAIAVFWGAAFWLMERGIDPFDASLPFLLVFLIPFLAVTWRRCHAKGHTGWITAVPFAFLALGIALAEIDAQIVHSETLGVLGAVIAFGGFQATGIALLVWLLLRSKPNTPGGYEAVATGGPERMSFTKSIRTCFRKFFIISGRASRSEYWWFALAYLLAGIGASIADIAIIGMPFDTGPIAFITDLVFFFPTFTVTIRRLHDTGRSVLYLLVPILGFVLGIAVGATIGTAAGQLGPISAGIVMGIAFVLPVWWMTRPSQPGPNKYGPNPAQGA